ncbi:MAG: DUF1302 family protein [Pseudomonadota bacterium]|nr:DUF1302 family protein [Pseudomonadota bacterium]
MKSRSLVMGLFLFTLFSGNLAADELEEALRGFDDFDNASTNESAKTPGADLGDLDESGFDDVDTNNVGIDISNAALLEKKSDWYSFSGYTSFHAAYNYAQKSESVVAPGDMLMDFSGLSRARIKGALTLDMKHGENWRTRFDVLAWYDASWSINGRDNYTEDVLDTYESFYDIKDAYIQGALTKSLDLKFGRQVVIWGKSDSIRITDIINPLDNREPGMVDIEDLRLSETMTKLDYYFGDWGLSGIIIHETRLEIEAAFGSDYRPSNIFGAPIPYDKFPDREDPQWNLKNTQYAMSLDGRFSGWDLSFYGAQVFDNRFDIEKVGEVPVRTYDIVNMGGIASNIVSGGWLFKAEAALINDINYRSTGRKNRLDALIGFDFNGLKDTVISVELANRHIFNYEEKMLTLTLQEAVAENTFPDFVRQDSIQIAFRTSYSFDHDNATANYLLSLAGGNGPGDSFDGGFQRLWIDYKYTDAVSLNAGVVDYIGGDGIIPFYRAIENNDRVFAEIKYSF